jgi:hypothetical protein
MRTERTSGAQRVLHRWWRAGAAVVLAHAVALAGIATDARGDDALPARVASPPRGLAVVALPGGERAAWSLAQAVYASDPLRPPSLDEAHARILAGEAPAVSSVEAGSATVPAELRDLADTRAAVRGDDAPSRALLASIATMFRVRGIVVVEMSASARPVARVFLADTGAFDAARYEADGSDASPDAGAGATATGWARTVASLARASGVDPVSAPRPVAQLSPETPLAPVAPPRTEAHAAGKSGAFYTSPWFWGAVGAAAFGGAAVYFATRDNGDGTIHLQVQVPK